jgi:hypothetical protein
MKKKADNVWHLRTNLVQMVEELTSIMLLPPQEQIGHTGYITV